MDRAFDSRLDRLELLVRLGDNPDNRSCLLDAKPVLPLLGALEGAAAASGQNFEACRAAEALERIAIVRDALGPSEIARVVRQLVLLLPGALAASPKAKPMMKPLSPRKPGASGKSPE